MTSLTGCEFFLKHSHAIAEDTLLPTGEKEQNIVDKSDFRMLRNKVVIISSAICLEKMKNHSRYINIFSSHALASL
jgi:hypothetical protein